MAKPDFSFIDKNIDAQRKLAREALEEARNLDAQLASLPENTPPAAKDALRRARQGFVKIARDAATNANTTSATATTIMSTVTAQRST